MELREVTLDGNTINTARKYLFLIPDANGWKERTKDEMPLPLFSLKVDFFTPKVFRNSAAAELVRRGIRPRTGSDILAVRMLPRSDSLAAQAALAKIDIRSKTASDISSIYG